MEKTKRKFKDNETGDAHGSGSLSGFQEYWRGGSVRTDRFQGPLFNLARDFSRLRLTHQNVKKGGVV